MGMGPAFVPRRRERRELLRRARRLLQTNGAVWIASNGGRTYHATTELVRVRQDDKGTVVRIFRPSGHPLTSWPRVLSSDWDGYEKLWNEHFLEPALEHLRSIQVLDDLSQA